MLRRISNTIRNQRVALGKDKREILICTVLMLHMFRRDGTAYQKETAIVGRSDYAPESLNQVCSTPAVAQRRSRGAAGTRQRRCSGHLVEPGVAVAGLAGEEEMEERAGRKTAASWSPFCGGRELRAVVGADLYKQHITKDSEHVCR
jgi:hypothetical protein